MELLQQFIIPISFLAIGAFSELLTMRNPSPGEQVGTAAGVLAVSAFGFAFPVEWALPVISGFLVARSGRITGFVLSGTVDKVRLWVDDRANSPKA